MNITVVFNRDASKITFICKNYEWGERILTLYAEDGKRFHIPLCNVAMIIEEGT